MSKPTFRRIGLLDLAYKAGVKEGARLERRALKRAWGGMSDEFDDWIKSRAKPAKRKGKP